MTENARFIRHPLILTLLGILCALGVGLAIFLPKPAWAATTYAYTWGQLEELLNQEGATDVVLGGGPFASTMTATSSVTVKSGQRVTLSNATGKLDMGAYSITVAKGASLSIQPSPDRVGTVSGQNLFIVEEGGELAIDGGIYRASATAIQNNGKFVMVGGSFNLYPRAQTASTIITGPDSETIIGGGTINGYGKDLPTVTNEGTFTLNNAAIGTASGTVLSTTGGICTLNADVKGTVIASDAIVNVNAVVNGRVEATTCAIDLTTASNLTVFALADGSIIDAHDNKNIYELSGTPSTIENGTGTIIFKEDSIPTFVNSIQNDWIFTAPAGVSVSEISYLSLGGASGAPVGSLTLMGKGSFVGANWNSSSGTLTISGPTVQNVNANCPFVMESGTVSNLNLGTYDASVLAGTVTSIRLYTGRLTLGNDKTGPTLTQGLRTTPDNERQVIAHKLVMPADYIRDFYYDVSSDFDDKLVVMTRSQSAPNRPATVRTQWRGNVLPESFAFFQFANTSRPLEGANIMMPGEITVPAGFGVSNRSQGTVIVHYPDGVATLAAGRSSYGPTQPQAPMSGSAALANTVTAASANIGVANTAAYTADSWDDYMSALGSATFTLSNSNSTEAAAAQAAQALSTSIHRLTPYSMSPFGNGDLVYLTTVAQDLDESQWTADSWSTLQDNLTTSIELANAGTADASQLETAITGLNNAINGLKANSAATMTNEGEGTTEAANPYRSLLETAYNTALSFSGNEAITYTTKSWSAYAIALEQTEAQLENPDADTASLTGALTMLNDAVLGLTEAPDPSGEISELAFWVAVAAMYPENEYNGRQLEGAAIGGVQRGDAA